MKEFMKVAVLVGALALILAVRAYAAPNPIQTPQPAMNTPQVITLTPVPQSTQQFYATPAAPNGQGSNGWGSMMGPMGRGMKGSGGMMGGKMGRMGRGGMHGGSNGSSQQQPIMAGVSHTHDDVAAQLGMTAQDVYNHMVSGKSLAQIAAEKGITEQQLMDGIMTGRRLAYEQAVRSGYMTQANADVMLQNMNDNLKAMINGQGTGSSGWSMMWDTEPGE